MELDAMGGYGLHCSQYVKHWLDLGIHVSVRPINLRENDHARIPMFVKRCFVRKDQPEPWEIAISPGFFTPLKRRKLCWFLMYEASLWSPKIVKLLNRADAAIVPCEFNRHGLRESGCTIPVHVVPLGYNDEVFKSSEMDMTGPCVFGTAGRQSHGHIRKGINTVIEAFIKEFPNEQDVRLHVKGMKDVPTRFVFDKRVVIRDAFLKEQQLAEWYSGLTCFVSAARGEAWGLMQMESCASGRPVIAAVYGGLQEFLTPENSYPVAFDESRAEESWQSGNGNWAVPDERHIRMLMRRVYNDRQEAREKGITAARQVSGFTWRNSAVKCLQVLESLGAL